MSYRKLILSMQVTLDGYVSDNDDKADWLVTGDDEWADLLVDIDSSDTFLLGRKMYPFYSEYWQSILHNPQSQPNELKFAKLADHTAHIVFTKNDFKPDWNNTRVAHNLVDEVTRLKDQPGKNIIAWGGANFAASLINHNLVDEYRIELNPTILTGGKSLFNDLKERKNLKLISSKQYLSGLILLRYQPKDE